MSIWQYHINKIIQYDINIVNLQAPHKHRYCQYKNISVLQKYQYIVTKNLALDKTSVTT
jgi:hypothetical protein